MAKRLRDSGIFLASGIYGSIHGDGSADVRDLRTGKKLDPYNVEDKIIIYERQVTSWFLNVGQTLSKDIDTGFVALMIALSYIEGVEQYRSGKPSNRQSKYVFIRGMKRIFGLKKEDEENLDKLYSHVRCGLFHNGMSDGELIISNDYNSSISFESGDICINVTRFISALIEDFDQYIFELNSPENIELRDNFEKMFSVT